MWVPRGRLAPTLAANNKMALLLPLQCPKGRIIITLLSLFALYLASYSYFRASHEISSAELCSELISQCHHRHNYMTDIDDSLILDKVAIQIYWPLIEMDCLLTGRQLHDK